MAVSKGVVTTATITFNNVTYKVSSAPIRKGVTREAVEVTDLSQSTADFVAGAVEKGDEFTITVYDDGTASVATSTAAQTLSMTATISDGTNTQSVTESFRALLTKVEPSTIESDGDRKATLDLTFQPTVGTTVVTSSDT